VIDPERIAAHVASLPTLPVVVMRLMTLLKDDRSSAHDFELAVRPDPALTSNLLRAANSALYLGMEPCRTVAQAIARVGTRRVFDVAAGGALQKVIPLRLAGYQIPSTAFWLHSIAVAVLSERLARKAKLDCGPHAFTAGLLHDLGKLVICEFLADEARALLASLEERQLTFVVAEHHALGTDHAEVGEEVARRWRLPEEIAAVARWHHQPERAPSHRALVAVVHVANALAHSYGYGTDAGELHRALCPEAVARLGLKPSAIEQVVGQSFDDIFTSAEQLGDGTKGV